MNFFSVPFFVPWLYPQLLWRVHTEEKILYLTFDDGPVDGPTDFVLETLAAHQAQATFFCIGDNVRKHPDLFRRVLKAGHRVGNHTFNHLKGWQTWRDQYVANVKLCDQQMSGEGWKDSAPLFRPPYGRIKRSQIRMLKEYQIVMWDVLTHDYAGHVSPEQCLQGSMHATRPGSIVVFHDSFKAEKNLRYVLPRYLEHFHAQGYRFHALPDKA